MGGSQSFALSLPHLTLLDATPPELVQAAAASGFDSVSLRLLPTLPGEAAHPMAVGSAMYRHTQSCLQDTGVQVLDIEAIWMTRHTELERLLPVFESAASLGARYVQVIGNDPEPGALVDCLGRLCDRGAGFGLSMALEFMAFSQVNSLQAAQQLLGQVAASNAVLTLDCLHIQRCGVSLAELSALTPEQVGLVQLCDAPLLAPQTVQDSLFEARFARQAPGQGELPLEVWLKALPQTSHIALEVPQPADGTSPNERARRLRAGMAQFMPQMPSMR